VDTLDFLRFVITAQQGGWLAIGSSLPDGSDWRNNWRAWPDDAESAVALIQGLKDEGRNVYYSPHLFTEQSARKEFVMDSRTLYCDLDLAEPALLPQKCSLLVRSSDEKYQGYWILEDWIPIEELETIQRRIAWGTPKADHHVWAAGHMMRVPNTFNWKYVPQQKVRVASYNKKTYVPTDFSVFPTLEASEPLAILPTMEWIEEALKVPVGYANAHTFWDAVRPRLEKGADVHFYTESHDRSRALWRLTTSCFRAGLSREEVFLIAYHSANNKFRALRYNGLRELARDVIRAEREIMMGPAGIRSRINDFRKATGTHAERHQNIAEACRNQMLSHGRFIHARGGTLWYILDNDGRPVPVTRSSTNLNVLLDTMFGLNPTEDEHKYVTQHLMNYTAGLPETGEIASLSHYLPDQKTLLLHTGAKDVWRITPDAIEKVTNGHKDIVFLWSEQVINPQVEEYDTDDTWHDALFGMSLDNLASDGVNAPQAMALLRAWYICLLMRNAIFSRPILAIFGQPGSGKSTLFKRVYALLYGPHKAVSGLGTAQEFDYAMATDPFLALDNIDTWEKWLPDRIARAAGISEITRRKLYTDMDTVTLRLQAFLGITAHNPKFGREDVLDRFIMITLERISNFQDETQIVQRILNNRDKYWGQIVQDVQKVLREPEAPSHTVAQFRVQDFSKVGQRIANALGFGSDFNGAIRAMVDQQTGFVLDEDSVLVNIIADYIRLKNYRNEEWQTPAKLWGYFDLIGGAQNSANFHRLYGNSVKLGRKLMAMHTALKQRFNVEWRFDPVAKTKVWRFLPLPEEGSNNGGDNGTQA
jgi:energy-coupling factor transporter ATP-binding protein EcfA2